MSGSAQLPRVARWLIAAVVPKDQRHDIALDLGELYLARRESRGAVYAFARLAADLISLARPSSFADVRQDLIFSLRLFRRQPLMIALSTIGLATAIGVSTAVFSIINGTALRSFGVSDPSSLYEVPRTESRPNGSAGYSTSWPYGQFSELTTLATQSDVAAYMSDGARFSRARDGVATSESIHLVSGNFFAVAGGRPQLGRVLTDADDQPNAAPAIVLGHGFWTRWLGSDLRVVGQTVWIGGVPVSIVGVAERSFTGPVDRPPAMWASFAARSVLYRSVPLGRSSSEGVQVFARPHQDVSATLAESELTSIARGLPHGAKDDVSATYGARLDAAGSVLSGPGGRQARLAVGLVLAVITLVLVLACANTANLMMARTATRRSEIAVRLALGAGRRRVVQQLLTESVSLGLAAGTLGLLITLSILPMIIEAIRVPSGYDVYPDARVFAFLVLVSTICGVLSGWGPARQSTSGDLWSPIQQQGGARGSRAGSGRTQRVLIGMQATASMVLLVVAALMTRSMLYVTHVELGFEPDRLIAVGASFPAGVFDDRRIQAYWRDAGQHLTAMPQIDRTSLALFPPFSRANMVTSGTKDGRQFTIYFNRTDAEFFSTAGIVLRRGRSFTADEVAAHAPVAVISETAAREWFGNDDPLGRIVDRFDAPSLRIIGVAAEAVTTRIRQGWSATVYSPLEANDYGAARMLVRARDAAASSQPVGLALETLEPSVGITARRVTDDMNEVLGLPRMLAVLSSSVGLMALALAVAGLYGVTSFAVNERAKEIGIRVAIGASRASVMGLLMRDHLRPVVLGAAAGSLLSLAAAPALAEALAGVSGRDPLSFGAAIAILLAAAIVAVLVPARRAAATDPTTVLRQS